MNRTEEWGPRARQGAETGAPRNAAGDQVLAPREFGRKDGGALRETDTDGRFVLLRGKVVEKVSGKRPFQLQSSRRNAE